MLDRALRLSIFLWRIGYVNGALAFRTRRQLKLLVIEVSS
jgi:hypothetical protein